MKRTLIVLCAAMLVALAACGPYASKSRASDEAPLSVFLLVRATPAWLALSPKDRFAFLEQEIQGRLEQHEGISMRFWDVEHLSARISDVILFEADAFAEYASLVEGLRETAFWGKYFEVVEILGGVENAYARHYGVEPLGGDSDSDDD